MFLAIRWPRLHEISPLMLTPKAPHSSDRSAWSRSIDFLHRNLAPILVVIFFAMWGWRAMTPRQLFATEEERARFLSSVGAPPSIRVITLGTEWCPACKQLEHQLTTDNIPHLALDVENNPIAGDLFRRAAEITGSNSVPKIILDKDVVSQPKLFLELARENTVR